VEHLNREQMVKYRDRELAPAELMLVDAHLRNCAECRAAVGGIGSGASLIAALGAARGEHLSYEQMDAWTENQLDSSERELVMAHLGLCDPCARQLRAYESYAEAMAAPIPPPARESTTLGDRLRAFFRSPRVALIAIVALVVLVLSPLAIRQTGHSGFLASFEGPTRPQALSDLPPNSDSTLVYPVSEAIEEQQPIFEWTETGNEPAEIFVFDAARKEVAHSDPISGTDWLASVPLDRGAVFTWEVRTAAGTRQASFRVLSDADHQKLATARAANASPMQVGEMARQMGALSEAQRQFGNEMKLDPGNAAAEKNLDQIRQLGGR